MESFSWADGLEKRGAALREYTTLTNCTVYKPPHREVLMAQMPRKSTGNRQSAITDATLNSTWLNSVHAITVHDYLPESERSLRTPRLTLARIDTRSSSRLKQYRASGT
jgi:hypothetical protein